MWPVAKKTTKHSRGTFRLHVLKDRSGLIEEFRLLREGEAPKSNDGRGRSLACNSGFVDLRSGDGQIRFADTVVGVHGAGLLLILSNWLALKS